MDSNELVPVVDNEEGEERDVPSLDPKQGQQHRPSLHNICKKTIRILYSIVPEGIYFPEDQDRNQSLSAEELMDLDEKQLVSIFETKEEEMEILRKKSQELDALRTKVGQLLKFLVQTDIGNDPQKLDKLFSLWVDRETKK